MNQIPSREPWWSGPFWRFVLIASAYLALILAVAFIIVWAT
jgi:hypothetical protein